MFASLWLADHQHSDAKVVYWELHPCRQAQVGSQHLKKCSKIKGTYIIIQGPAPSHKWKHHLTQRRPNLPKIMKRVLDHADSSVFEWNEQAVLTSDADTLSALAMDIPQPISRRLFPFPWSSTVLPWRRGVWNISGRSGRAWNRYGRSSSAETRRACGRSRGS